MQKKIIDEQVESTRQSCGDSQLLTIGRGWPNFKYWKELLATIQVVRSADEKQLAQLARPKYLAAEHNYSEKENVTKEANSNVAGSRNEQVAGVVTIAAQSSL